MGSFEARRACRLRFGVDIGPRAFGPAHRSTMLRRTWNRHTGRFVHLCAKAAGQRRCGRPPSRHLDDPAPEELDRRAGCNAYEDFHDWPSPVRPGFVGRVRHCLFRHARERGSIRWRLEHDRGDDPRPLRNRRHRPRSEARPNLFHRRILRVLSDTVGRPSFAVGERPDRGGGRSARRARNWTVHAGSGRRNLDRSRTLGSVLGLLERQSLLTPAAITQLPKLP